MTPLYFASPAEWRKWLTRHHRAELELWVGFHKRGTGQPSLTWPQSVDEALCYGWIDGVRKRVDGELTTARRMRAVGVKAFSERTAEKSGVYSYQRRETATLRKSDAAALKRDSAAWKYFSSRPPWYRRVASFWVVSAKLEATRQRRLSQLIACSAAGQPIGPLKRP